MMRSIASAFRVSTPRVLLTGARSLVGHHVATDPALDGRVRGMSRKQSSGPANYRANLLDPQTVDAALDGCDVVIHAASRGPVSGVVPEVDAEARRLHVDGTRRLLQRAAAAGVRRVVIGLHPCGLGTSALADRLDVLSEVHVARRAGVDVRMLWHGIPVGAGDVGPSWIGRAMVEFAAGGLRSYVPGVLPLASAADVGRTLAALALDDEFGGPYNRLVSHDVDASELLEMWADEVGPRSRVRPRSRRALELRLGPVGSWMQRRALEDGFDARLAGRLRPVSWTESDEVTLEPTEPLATSIAEGFSWFSEHGSLRRARARLLAS